MTASVRRFREFRWDEVETLPYKGEGSARFAAVSRQVLFGEAALACELRYFELAAGGYSTLERHQHTHGVVVFRGRGHCLLGTTVKRVQPFDLVTIPALTWHQFRATCGETFGFLCMVNRERDRPLVPTEDELAGLRQVAAVAAFLDGVVD